MKTEKELNANILTITLLIKEHYPELEKYISEMPVSIPNISSPEMSVNALNDYYISLEELVKKYEANHTPLTTNQK